MVEAGQESGTPYGYVFDDPMKFTDPDGRSPDITIDGSNNSSLTIKTDLINVRVNVDIDLHGNHTIDGEAAVQTGLDFVSLFDPTGITSVLSAGISAKNGNYLDAAMGVLGAIPIAGELAKAEKVAKDVKLIDKLVADGEKVASDAEKVAGKVEELPKPGKGKGTVDKVNRDAKRTYTKSETTEKLAEQKGNCAKCGQPKTISEVHGHHKVRHADGGRTTSGNLAAVCKPCHVEIHK